MTLETLAEDPSVPAALWDNLQDVLAHLNLDSPNSNNKEEE